MVTVRFRPLCAATAAFARVGRRRARVTRRRRYDGVGVCHEETAAVSVTSAQETHRSTTFCSGKNDTHCFIITLKYVIGL